MQLSLPQKYFGARGFFGALLTIYVLLILAIDMYIPALASMQRSFQVSASYLNLTVFAFFICSAFGVIISGPLSDHYGRKPLLVGGCLLFTLSSLACTIAPTIEALILFRIVQALGFGAVTTIETALIKDAYRGKDLNVAMTCLQSLIIVGPAVAPFLGTFILSLSDWRGIFAFLTLCGGISLLLACLVTETHTNTTPQRTKALRGFILMARNTIPLLHDRAFVALALFMGVAGIPYFAFIATISYILLNFFQVSYTEYSLIYAGACLITVIAPFVYMRLSRFWNMQPILKLCITLTLISFVFLGTGATLNPFLFLMAFAPYALAEGIVRPLAFVVLLNQPSHRVGAASSFANFAYSLLTSLATILATLDWPNFIFGIVALTGASCFGMIGLYAWGLTQKRT